MQCEDCGSELPLQVCKSEAGYYVGRWCPKCGPYERCTGYSQSDVATKLQLEFMKAMEGDEK